MTHNPQLPSRNPAPRMLNHSSAQARFGNPFHHLLTALLLASLLGLPAAQAGQPPIIVKTTVDQLLTIAKDEGYAVSLDDDGDLMWKIEGFRTYLLISDSGEYIQFQTSFEDTEATLETVNAWNQTKRYSRTYLDDDGDPILELDLDLEGGVTHARIVDYLKTCRLSFQSWMNEVVN